MKIKPPFIACLLLFLTVGIIALLHRSPEPTGNPVAASSPPGRETIPSGVAGLEPLANAGRAITRIPMHANRGEGPEIFSYADSSSLPPVSGGAAEVKSVLSRKAIHINLAELDAIRDKGTGMIQIDAGKAGWITASIGKVIPNWGGGYSLSGKLPGSKQGTFMATVNDGSVVAEIRGSTAGGGEFTICSNSAGTQEFREVDRTALHGCGGALDGKKFAADRKGEVRRDFSSNGVKRGSSTDNGSVIDVMVVYTSSARNALGGTAGMVALINQAINETNESFIISQAGTTFNLAHAAETSYGETLDIELDLTLVTMKTDGFMDEVHALRDQYNADIVSLWTNGDYPDAAGIGWTMSDLSPEFEEVAFNVCTVGSAVSNFTFAHECGHNMGCQHDFANGNSDSLFPYSFGHRWAGASGNQFRSIMAYLPGIRVPYFSNPDVTYDGVPTGTPVANNALSIRNARSTVANWRQASANIPENTITIQDPNGGERLFRGAPVEINWESNVTGNVAIDLMRGSNVVSVIAGNEVNVGRYAWTVPDNLPVGSNYFIRVRTLTNEVDVSDRSNRPFSVVTGDFPSGNKLPVGWVKPKNAARGWVPVQGVSVEGGYSLGSEPIGDGQRAAISYSSVFRAGTISFYLKVSSELNFDVFRFLVDGVEVDLEGTIEGVSGDVNWKYVSYDLPAGQHTLTWAYIKDDSYGDLEDRAWIDGVILPSELQEISVFANKKGLTSEKARVVFDPVKVGEEGRVTRFVIRNTGRAPLSSISPVILGADKKDFVLKKPDIDTLAPGKQMVVSVRFAPNRTGPRRAVLSISSNDSNEDPFRIRLVGRGEPLPRIRVFQPGTRELVAGRSTVAFGQPRVGTRGVTKVFTVSNTGAATLRNLRVRMADGNVRSRYFELGPLGVNRLEPGELTTFRITFRPRRAGAASATLIVRSDDPKRNPFRINLKGAGRTRFGAAAAKSALLSSGSTSPDSSAITTHSTITSGGDRFLTLSVDKSASPLESHIVEVSPDLVHWFSGKRHTTLLKEDEEILKVRDNTPLKVGVKRYIRSRETDN